MPELDLERVRTAAHGLLELVRRQWPDAAPSSPVAKATARMLHALGEGPPLLTAEERAQELMRTPLDQWPYRAHRAVSRLGREYGVNMEVMHEAAYAYAFSVEDLPPDRPPLPEAVAALRAEED